MMLALGCNKKKSSSNIKVSVVNDFSFSEETKKYLVSLYTQVVDDPVNDELLFTNYRSEVGIVITDYNGEFIQKLGEKGRGPKEIQSSRYFGTNGKGKVVILDKALASFKEFDRETEEVNIFSYPIKQGVSVTSRNLTFCKDRWYAGFQLIGKATLPSTPTISVFDKSFNLLDTLGGYDPFFGGRQDVLQETSYSLDCENQIIYTVQGKTPKIQSFSTQSGKSLSSTLTSPSSFNVSEKFITMVANPQEMSRYLSEEQSISLHLAQNKAYVFLVFRNDSGVYKRNRVLNESEHFVAIYDKETLEFLGEVKVSGAILGATKRGNLIMLKDEENLQIQIIQIVVEGL